MNPHYPHKKTTSSLARSKQPETAGKIRGKKDVVILQPVAIRIPNSDNVYSPSQVKSKKKLNKRDFLSKYAKHPRGIRICFDDRPTPDTILQKSELITAYGYSLDCWYILDESC